MIRESIGKHYIGMNKEFRFRGEEPDALKILVTVYLLWPSRYC